jgi:hypothetical protein
MPEVLAQIVRVLKDPSIWKPDLLLEMIRCNGVLTHWVDDMRSQKDAVIDYLST